MFVGFEGLVENARAFYGGELYYIIIQTDKLYVLDSEWTKKDVLVLQW